MYYYEGYMGYFGWFGMILFLGAVWFIMWLVNKSKDSEQKEKTPLQIAKERFAKGEITKKQFDEIKKEL